MTLLIGAGLAGVFFGLSYHFLVLAPLTLAAGVTCSLTASLLGQDGQSTIVAAVLPAVGLQAGYLVGVAARISFANLPKGHGSADPGVSESSVCSELRATHYGPGAAKG